MKVKCPNCQHIQIYSPRSGVMPKRPKTKCSECLKDFDCLPNEVPKVAEIVAKVAEKPQLKDDIESLKSIRKALNNSEGIKSTMPKTLPKLAEILSFDPEDMIQKLIMFGEKSMNSGYQQIANCLQGDTHNAQFQRRRIYDTVYMIEKILREGI